MSESCGSLWAEKGGTFIRTAQQNGFVHIWKGSIQPIIMWLYFSLNKTPKYSNCIHWSSIHRGDKGRGKEKDWRETAPWSPSRSRFSHWCCLTADYLQAKIICGAIISCACLANLLQEEVGADLWDHSVFLMGSAHSHWGGTELNWESLGFWASLP